MQIALGVLMWTPDAFWRSTPHEVMAGLEGYQLSQGSAGDGDQQQDDYSQWAAEVMRAEALRDRRAARERMLHDNGS